MASDGGCGALWQEVSGGDEKPTTRRRSFHPVHRASPGNLLGRRFTVIFGSGGRSEAADNWSETWETSGWTGYTLFLQRKDGQPDRPNRSEQPQQNDAAATQLEAGSEHGDGSFELITDDGQHAERRSTGPSLRALSLLTPYGAMGSSWSSASTGLVIENGRKPKVVVKEVLHYAANGEGNDGPSDEPEGERPERSRSPVATGANESLLDDLANYDPEALRLQCGISSLTARPKATPRQIEHLDPNSGYVRNEDAQGNRD
eukprot:s366_g66.t1